MNPRTFTTAQAAKKAGISRQTLHAWMSEGLVIAPKPVMVGKREFRFWTQQDIDRLKSFRGSLKPGPKKARTR
ncbi:MAG: MerR family transcriptional regulator [Candidatus Sulfotelmatobacter sp.]